MLRNENHKFIGYALIVAFPAVLLAVLGGFSLREDRVNSAVATRDRGLVIINELRAFRETLGSDLADTLTPTEFHLSLAQFGGTQGSSLVPSLDLGEKQGREQRLGPGLKMELEEAIASDLGWEKLHATLPKKTESEPLQRETAMWLLAQVRDPNPPEQRHTWKVHRALFEACSDLRTELGTPIGLLNLLWLIQNPLNDLDLNKMLARFGEETLAFESGTSQEYLKALISAIDRQRRSLGSGAAIQHDADAELPGPWGTELEAAHDTIQSVLSELRRRNLKSQAFRLAALELHLDDAEPRPVATFDFQGDAYLAWVTESKDELVIRLVSDVAKELERALIVVGADRDFAVTLNAAHLRIGDSSGGQEIVRQSLESTSRWPAIDAGVFIVDPTSYFAEVAKRRWRFGGLILLSLGSVAGGLTALLRALRRQQRLNEQQSNFVASVSHELRTPTASISLLAEELQSGNGDRRDYPQMIHAESQRLSCLVENVLDISRIDRGSKVYEFEACDAKGLLLATVTSFQPTARKNNIYLNFKGPKKEIDCDLDVVALQRALTNLLDNAVKFSQSGQQVDVTVSVEDDELAITVRDYGKGMSVEEQKRIFEPFQRLGTEMRRETVGVGLGLSLVKHIVLGHGGRIDVESKLGLGSTFQIRLPRRQDET